MAYDTYLLEDIYYSGRNGKCLLSDIEERISELKDLELKNYVIVFGGEVYITPDGYAWVDNFITHNYLKFYRVYVDHRIEVSTSLLLSTIERLCLYDSEGICRKNNQYFEKLIRISSNKMLNKFIYLMDMGYIAVDYKNGKRQIHLTNHFYDLIGRGNGDYIPYFVGLEFQTNTHAIVYGCIYMLRKKQKLLIFNQNMLAEIENMLGLSLDRRDVLIKLINEMVRDGFLEFVTISKDEISLSLL